MEDEVEGEGTYRVNVVTAPDDSVLLSASDCIASVVLFRDEADEVLDER